MQAERGQMFRQREGQILSMATSRERKLLVLNELDQLESLPGSKGKHREGMSLDRHVHLVLYLRHNQLTDSFTMSDVH